MQTEINNFLRTLGRSPNTIRSYSWALHYFLDSVGDDAPLTAETYAAFLDQISNLSPSTKAIFKAAIGGLYDFCDAGDPAAMRKANKQRLQAVKHGPVNFDREAVEAVINHCQRLRGDLFAMRDRAFVLTLADTGLRISEICALKRGDLDMLEQRALVTGKRDKTAVVRFSRRSLAAIREYLAARASLDGASGRPLATLPLFAAHDIRARKRVRPIGAAGMRKAIKDRMEEAGVKPLAVRIHDFRHYFVTITMLASGGNLKLAQELARHESPTTTGRYAHFTTGEIDRAYAEIFNR